MTVTDRTVNELIRCLSSMQLYRQEAQSGYTSGPNHAAAMRASMDCTRILAEFRRTGVSPHGTK